MVIWVLYDIRNDRNRSKVSKICKKAGLYRVQYSCFLGTLDSNEKDSIALQIEDMIEFSVDKVYIFTMNQDQLRNCEMLGQAFDKKLVSDEVKALFF